MINLEMLLKYLDMILLFVLVVFLFVILRRLLGKKVGYTRKDEVREEVAGSRNYEEDDIGLEIGLENSYPVGSLAYKVEMIAKKDTSFKEKKFVESSKKAFEMIVTGFAHGDMEKIKPFLNEKIYNHYQAVVKEREMSQSRLHVEIKQFLITDIYDASIDSNGVASIKVKFVTEQLRETIENNSSLPKGDRNNIKTFSEIWTFSKNLKENVSIWILTRTASV